MIWATWGDFFHMGGYGLYVWGSYVVTAICIAAELVLARKRFGDALKRAARLQLAGRKGARDETET